MNLLLWGAQVLLAIGFLGTGYFHAFKRATTDLRPEMAWMNDLNPGLLKFIGLAELAGGLGVVLPMLTGIQPWLSPLAAALLALVMALAFGFHLMRKEYKNLLPNTILFLLAVFVAWGRWGLFPS